MQPTCLKHGVADIIAMEIFWLVKLIKGYTTYYFYKKFPEIKIDLQRGRLWAKGYWVEEIKDRIQFNNTFIYIKNNKDLYIEKK